jgi:uncharacterized protein YrrD
MPTHAMRGFTLVATDGEVGAVHDFYFDDEKWAIRYVVAETGAWLGQHLKVQLTKQQVKNSPEVDLLEPISRQIEAEYYNYYGWPAYWDGPGLWGAVAHPAALAGVPRVELRELVEKSGGDPHLRSVNEVTGYRIQARDDEIGHLKDFVIEEQTWQICYMVVDTRHWLPRRKVLVPTAWIDRISWSDQEVGVLA